MKKRIAVIALVLGVMIGTMVLPSFAAGVSAPKATGSVGYTAGYQRYAAFNNIGGSADCAWGWNVSGVWNIGFTLNGSAGLWTHDATVSQTGPTLSGGGGYPAGGPYEFAWTVMSGSVAGNQLSLTIDYTLGAIGTTMHMSGTIAPDGSMAGIWDDNYYGARTGSWSSSAGSAHVVAGRNTFSYWDAADLWYTVCVTASSFDGAAAWFAGPVVAGNVGAGQWLFAKVQDGGEPAAGADQIWGSFTTEIAAVSGVTGHGSPGDGPFDITSGNLQVH